MTNTLRLAALGLFALSVAAGAQAGKRLTIIDPNLATEQELLALPHMNAALVKGLLDKRPFMNMTEVHAQLSPSLSATQLTELYAKMFVQLNLNAATREEILLVPGAGPRMAREFLEYRPYKALAQFHREIGKYVNAEELARLEQYVFVPIDLNIATDDDILSLPGVGSRMLREFKEYRPYKSIEQFRREIGKYVNQKELGRLERYVVVTP